MTAPDRRTADRRVSPAVGEFAIQQNVKLRESHARLLEALQRISDGQVMPKYFTHADTVHEYQRIASAAIAKAEQQ